MKQSGAKAISVLLFAVVMIIPFQTNAFSLDDAVRSYVAYLRQQIATLQAENAQLRAKVARLEAGTKVSANESEECDALSEEVAKNASALTAYEKETNAKVAAMQKNTSGMSADAVAQEASAYVTQRNAGWTALSDKGHALKSQWNRECL